MPLCKLRWPAGPGGAVASPGPRPTARFIHQATVIPAGTTARTSGDPAPERCSATRAVGERFVRGGAVVGAWAVWWGMRDDGG
jgi:hypothetical protein